MNKNIKIEYNKGEVQNYITMSSEDLYIPSCAFKTEAEAEFCVSLCKMLKQSGRETTEVIKLIPYMFRMAGIKSDWSDITI